MGTRSFVGVMKGDKCHAVYVHWDGYLEGVGRDLQAYKTQKDVLDLIKPGDRSSLEGEYYKDRGEANVGPREYATFEKFFKACSDSWGEYYYIFKDGVWYCGCTYEGTLLHKALHTYEQALAIQETERIIEEAEEV